MGKVKSYMEFLNESGGLLGHSAVSSLAAFIDPTPPEKKTKEEIQDENPDMANADNWGEFNDDLQSWVNLSDFFCGEVALTKSKTYRVTSGPNKGKSGTYYFSSSGNPSFDLPTGVKSWGDLAGPDAEYMKKRFPGYEFYSQFLTVEYETGASPFNIKYYDKWQTYGTVNIEYDKNRTSGEAFKWSVKDGPNSGMSGNTIVWIGTESTVKNNTKWGKYDKRTSKGKSPFAGLLNPWDIREVYFSGKSLSKDSIQGDPVDYKALKKGKSEELRKARIMNPNCEDPQHFLFLGIPEGEIIKAPSKELFYNMYLNLFKSNGYEPIFKKEESIFYLKEAINGRDAWFKAVKCLNNNIADPGDSYLKKEGVRSNLFFKCEDLKMQGEWYWDFLTGAIGIVSCVYSEGQNKGKIVPMIEGIEKEKTSQHKSQAQTKPQGMTNVPGSPNLKKDPISGDVFNSSGSVVKLNTKN